LRVLAIAVAVHGALFFAIASASLARADSARPETLSEAYYFLIVAPALVLAAPFSPLLWRWHLMATPGWFAWPMPAGFLLVYAAWVMALLVLSRLAAARR
jgi:hypothetical protein